MRLLPGIDPDQLVGEAKAEHRPIATVCLFSGGNDSTVLAHRCRDHYDSLVHIDTGTAVPGVREFVEQFAAWLGKPLKVYEAGNEFRRMVLGIGANPRDPDTWEPLGFPGPGQHGLAYNLLKARQLEQLLRDLKEGHPRSARALYLTGVRRGESRRRAKRLPITRKGGAVFASPLIDWTNYDMHQYRATHQLPQSDVAALIHRSGECNCGAFAAAGEREMLASLWPDWFERTIASLEREAEARGVRHCRWGERPRSIVEWAATEIAAGQMSFEEWVEQQGEPGPMCSDCQTSFEEAA